MGFTGVYIIFLISAQKHRLWVLGAAVLTRTHNLCFEQKSKKYQKFLSENFHFLVVKFSVHLNRHVFVMLYLHESMMLWVYIRSAHSSTLHSGSQIDLHVLIRTKHRISHFLSCSVLFLFFHYSVFTYFTMQYRGFCGMNPLSTAANTYGF